MGSKSEGLGAKAGRRALRLGRLRLRDLREAIGVLRADARFVLEGLRGQRRPSFELRKGLRVGGSGPRLGPGIEAARDGAGLIRHTLGPERVILITEGEAEASCPGEALTVEIRDGETRRSFRTIPGEAILEGAFEADVDLPYSCRAGGCAACRVRLRRGTVVMPSHHCLSPEELAEGYVLTCVGHAAGDLTLEVE